MRNLRDNLRDEMKSLLKRTDIVGYGSAKPRVAVVVVVPPPQTDSSLEEQTILNGALESVESVFRTTDRNRLFIVTVVMDGRGKMGWFESKIQDIDSGKTAHRHGEEVHKHQKVDSKENVDKGENSVEHHAHSEKIHTIYNHASKGVSASRKEAVSFINILATKHEQAGLKSPEEDPILLFLRCDASLREFKGKRTWLDDVTDALVLGDEDTPVVHKASSSRVKGTVASKTITEELSPPANAVSFVVDYSSADDEGNVEVRESELGEVFSFDDSLEGLLSSATGQQMSLSNGESYQTPVTQAATALRLDTYNNFPSHDEHLTNHFSADLELSFNLWMCADGIDILGTSLARVVVDHSVLSPKEKTQIPGPLAARLTSAWMSGHDDEKYLNGILTSVATEAAEQYLHLRGENAKDHTMTHKRRLSDKTTELKHKLVRMASEAKQTATFPHGLESKCRPFSWYAQNVHPLMNFDKPELSASAAKEKAERLKPSVKLSDENMRILARASPVKLNYVDASGGHKVHPHRGGTDEQGNFGYVHDETALRLDPPSFQFKNDSDREKLCRKGDPNYKMLTEKVFVDLTAHEAAEKRAEHGLAERKRAKIFCLVYTIEKYHNRIPPLRETWLQKCDGSMVASTKTDRDLGTVNIPHEGPEEYNNIWQKVRAMWSYIYDNYYEKYDWFHIGGDDLYLLVENLRLYLESEEILLASNGGQLLPDGSEDQMTPLFLGRRFAEGGDRERMFISGGAGYTMNKAGLKALVVDGFPNCFPHMKTFSEDVMVATCFRKMGILPFDTKDEAGGERYMPFQPGHHLTYRPPANPKDDWYSNYSVDVHWGIDHCASKSVAFHYIKEDLQRRMHAILYHHC